MVLLMWGSSVPSPPHSLVTTWVVVPVLVRDAVVAVHVYMCVVVHICVWVLSFWCSVLCVHRFCLCFVFGLLSSHTCVLVLPVLGPPFVQQHAPTFRHLLIFFSSRLRPLQTGTFSCEERMGLGNTPHALSINRLIYFCFVMFLFHNSCLPLLTDLFFCFISRMNCAILLCFQVGKTLRPNQLKK